MLLEYVTAHSTVQVVFLIVMGGCFCFSLGLRRARQSEELKSADQRQKDLIPISQRIAHHKEREKKAGHQLAPDWE